MTIGICLGRVLLWPLGEVSASSKASNGGVEDDGVEDARRSTDAICEELEVGVEAPLDRFFVVEDLSFLLALSFLEDLGSLSLSEPFGGLGALAALKLDQTVLLSVAPGCG